MAAENPLFDNNSNTGSGLGAIPEILQEALKNPISKNREEKKLHKLKDLDENIASAINKVKALKESIKNMERRIEELEARLHEKEAEIEGLSSEKNGVKAQIQGLLNELETLDIG